jgi:hypothetical protein
MAADLYVIEPLPDGEEPGALRKQPDAHPVAERLTTAGIWVAVIASTLQLVGHFANAATIDSPHLDANVEHNLFTWVGSCAVLFVAVAASVAVLLDAPRRRLLIALAAVTAFFAADEAVVLHENIAFGILGAVGLGDVWDSVLWPLLYLPLLVGTVVALLVVAREAPARGRRCIHVGLGLLAFALLLEIASTPWSVDRNPIHTVEGGLEETAELAGWILIATGIAALGARPLARHARIRRIGPTS